MLIMFVKRNVMSVQFDLFEAIPDEMELLRQEMRSLKDSQDRQRKNLFAKNAELGKLYMNLKNEVDALKHQIVILARNK